MDSEVIAIQLWLVGMQHYHRLWCYGPLWPFIELIVPAMGCYNQKQVLLMGNARTQNQTLHHVWVDLKNVSNLKIRDLRELAVLLI